eukprot:TRINITY_DN34184_c0_g2_i1.p1 TRINITY_DN34184_c0_g2~~TRINITY_DN34184_c0_g2_i1.p1  ORF type:complete len:351 (-),score=63.58 TRINITY_DN34184_c0_g2_i1:231-1283(-)
MDANQVGQARKWAQACKVTDDEMVAAGTGVRTLSYHNDLVIVGSAHKALKVWQIGESKLSVSRKLCDAAVGAACVEVSSENLIAACYDDGCIGIWDLRQPSRVFSLESTSLNAWKVKFLTTGYQLLSGGTSGSLCIWDLRARRLEVDIVPESANAGPKKEGEDDPPKKRQRGEGDKKALNRIHSLAVSADGAFVACGRGSGDLSVMRLENREWVGDVSAHRAEHVPAVRGLSFDESSRLLVSGGDDCHMCILSVAEWAKRGVPTETRLPHIERFSAHRSWIGSVTMLSARETLTTSMDGTVRLFDIAAKKHVQTFKDHTDAVFASASAGRYFVTGGMDATLAMYKVADAS